MRAPFLTPRRSGDSRRPGQARPDLGTRTAVMARQRVRRGARRQREPVGWFTLIAVAAALVAVVLVATGLIWLGTSERLAVRSITVEGASRVSTERVIQAAGISTGTNIFRIHPEASRARLEALPEIRRAEVVREL